MADLVVLTILRLFTTARQALNATADGALEIQNFLKPFYFSDFL